MWIILEAGHSLGPLCRHTNRYRCLINYTQFCESWAQMRPPHLPQAASLSLQVTARSRDSMVLSMASHNCWGGAELDGKGIRELVKPSAVKGMSLHSGSSVKSRTRTMKIGSAGLDFLSLPLSSSPRPPRRRRSHWHPPTLSWQEAGRGGRWDQAPSVPAYYPAAPGGFLSPK